MQSAFALLKFYLLTEVAKWPSTIARLYINHVTAALGESDRCLAGEQIFLQAAVDYNGTLRLITTRWRRLNIYPCCIRYFHHQHNMANTHTTSQPQKRLSMCGCSEACRQYIAPKYVNHFNHFCMSRAILYERSIITQYNTVHMHNSYV